MNCEITRTDIFCPFYVAILRERRKAEGEDVRVLLCSMLCLQIIKVSYYNIWDVRLQNSRIDLLI